MSGPPSGFPTGPPPPSSVPPSMGGPEPVQPKRGGLPKVVMAAVLLFVICFALGVGLYLGGKDDDDSSDTEAIVSTTEVPDEGDAATSDETPDTVDPFEDDASGGEVDPEDPLGGSLDDLLGNLPEGWEDLLPDELRGQLDDLSDLGDLDDLDIPGVTGVQVTIVFDADASQRRIDAVHEAFEDSDLVSFVQFLTAEELEDFTGGMPVPPSMAFDTLTAFGRDGADPDDTRDFACSFADDPAVEVVQVFGAEACGPTL